MADDDRNDKEWWELALLGFLLLITPMVQMIRDGVRGDGDLVQWLMSKPLNFHQMVRASMIGGISLILIGVMLFYMGRL